MHKRWFVNRTNPQYIRYLCASASIPPVLAQILINRGLKTAKEIDSFLNSGFSTLTDPLEMQGVRMAVERIAAAVKRGERVLVHGDYDADGLTATAILVGALRALGADCGYWIPHRRAHGYGFNSPGVEAAKRVGAALVIAVDCGITAFEAVNACSRAGIDVIVADHHEPALGGADGVSDTYVLPDAAAVINPKVTDRTTPLAFLSGAGIAFKLAHALSLFFAGGFAPEEFLDLAALGTIADSVPLIGENRCLVKEGLKSIAAGERAGLRALKHVAGIDGKRMRAGLVAFTIAPRINAAGRMDDANDVVKLLLTGSIEEATDIASLLEKRNAERQRVEQQVYQEALDMVRSKGVPPVIVLGAEGWHGGVIGIVASRLAEQFHRPAILFSIEGDLACGSARSIPAFDLNAGFSSCRDLLRRFGGHAQAAGVELDVKDMPLFEERINRHAHTVLKEEDLLPVLEIDAQVDLSEITIELTEALGALEPFGCGNPEPLLGSKDLEILSPRIVGDNHLKMRLRQRNQSIEAIGFEMAPLYEDLAPDRTVDAVFTPLVHEWAESRYLQLHLKALRPSR